MSVDDLDRALAGVDRLLLDSSSLIAFHSPSERTHRGATSFGQFRWIYLDSYV